MRRASFLLAFIVALLAFSAWAGEPKDYPLTLNVVGTSALVFKADGTRATTDCTVSSNGTDISCDSRSVPNATHTELVSFATASDGKAYAISCAQNAGGRFAQASLLVQVLPQ